MLGLGVGIVSLWGVLSIAEWVLVGPGVTDGRVSCFGPCVGALQKPDHSLDRSTGLRGGGSQKRPFNPTGYPFIKVLKGGVCIVGACFGGSVGTVI